MEDISPKEIFIGFIFVLLVIASAIFCESFVFAGQRNNILKYEQAVKTDNANTFQYAKRTQAGNVLANGNLVANEEVGLPELTWKFAGITRVYEEYRMHTREVCTSDKKGNQTCHTETYYTWDYISKKEDWSKTFTFLGVVFSKENLRMENVSRLSLSADNVSKDQIEMIDGDYLCINKGLFGGCNDKRYYYKVTVTSTARTIFVRFFDNKATDPISGSIVLNVRDAKSPDQIIKDEENAIGFAVFMYYLCSIVLFTMIYGAIAYYILQL